MNHDEYEMVSMLREQGKEDQEVPQEVKLKIACEILKEISHDWKEEDIKFYPKSLGSFDEVISDLSKIKLEEYKTNEEKKNEDDLQEVFKAIESVEKMVNRLIK